MSFAELVWTEDDMEYFLRTVCSFETHKTIWRKRCQERLDEGHKHYEKPMPRMIPPSYVRLFQLTVAQVHSKKWRQHFGAATIENILHTPIQVLAEQRGVAVSAAVATNFQIKVFTEDTRIGIDKLTRDLDKVEYSGYVQEARDYTGSGLFKFVLNRAQQHVAAHTKKQNCFEYSHTGRV